MTLTNFHILLVGGTLFGLIGFLRGVAREIITTIGIIIAYAAVKQGESSLVSWANRLFRMAMFALRGGLAGNDPTAAWGQVSGLTLVKTDGDKLILKLFVFVSAVILAYIVGNKRLSGKTVPFGPLAIYPNLPLMSRTLGLVAGLMEGYLIAYFVIPEIFPKRRTVISLPTGETVSFLGKYMPFVFVGFVAILIAFGLRSASLKK
jgi:uncharacterized membrane protein required for colicin V production